LRDGQKNGRDRGGESERSLEYRKSGTCMEVDWGQIESKEDSFFTSRLFGPIKTGFNREKRLWA
jgi:hypothetical protein